MLVIGHYGQRIASLGNTTATREVELEMYAKFPAFPGF